MGPFRQLGICMLTFLQITVEWPQGLRDSDVTMKDVLGTGLEKLDPIRLDDEVFIKAGAYYSTCFIV